MRIIITGGFGYLGQRLAKYFHDLGSTVFLGSRDHKKAVMVDQWQFFYNRLEQH